MVKVKNYYLVLLLLFCGACFSKKRSFEAIRVRGSDSEVNLAQALAEAYMDKDAGVSIGVTGGGSGAGIASLINHKTDLANSSRSFTKEEMFYAGKRKVKPIPIVFALDAIAIIVHKDNPIASLSVQQLAAIYAGKIKSWKEINGQEYKITAYGRQSSSGTYLYFREYVVKTEYANNMIGMSGTAQIVEALKADANGIGYVSSGYLSKEVLGQIKVIGISKTAADSAYTPLNQQHLNNDLYPIIRPLYQYADGVPKGKLMDFVQYELSAEGAAIIKENGFQPVFGKYKKQNEILLNKYEQKADR